MTAYRLAFLGLPLALVAVACSGSGDTPARAGGVETGDGLVAVVASYDLALGRPGRFIVGLFNPEKGNIGYGTVGMRFRYRGTGQGKGGDVGPWTEVTGAFLPIPGSQPRQAPDGPVRLEAAEGRGVYAATAAFGRAGFWEVEVSASLRGGGEQSTAAAFEVLPRHQVPAVGEAAPASQNLTVDSTGTPPSAIDSRALGDAPVPDPELHRTTIAAAMAAHRPVLVVFSTPTFCVSRFCGPVTDMVAELAGRYADRASFIHVEVWKDFEAKQLNDTAAEWLTSILGKVIPLRL